jgi:hypothetical protein
MITLVVTFHRRDKGVIEAVGRREISQEDRGRGRQSCVARRPETSHERNKDRLWPA